MGCPALWIKLPQYICTVMDLETVKKNVKDASKLLKVLSNERRLMIVCALHKGEESVGALEELSDLSQSALSQHLARLRRDGIVKTRREAQTIYYSLNNEKAEAVLECLHRLYCPDYTGPCQ